jgi:hypothetical protein
VKRLEYSVNNKTQIVIKLTDVSGSILYNIASGEKKLLTLINAAISHEMRNPINSMRS